MPHLATALVVTLLTIVIVGYVAGLAWTTIAGLAGAALVAVWLWG